MEVIHRECAGPQDSTSFVLCCMCTFVHGVVRQIQSADSGKQDLSLTTRVVSGVVAENTEIMLILHGLRLPHKVFDDAPRLWIFSGVVRLLISTRIQ